jgi:hypothetical protein
MVKTYYELCKPLEHSGFFIRRFRLSDECKCICSALDDTCGDAKYEWLYTEEEMNRPGCEDWIPLCETCCVYWRRHATRPYRVKTLTAKCWVSTRWGADLCTGRPAVWRVRTNGTGECRVCQECMERWSSYGNVTWKERV